MASGPSVSMARTMLDMALGSGVDVRLWTDAPDFTGSAGLEVSGGGYAPTVVTFDPAVDGVGGQIAKATNQGSFVFADMPVASSDVVAISIHDHATGDAVWVNDSWSPPVSWAVGESPMFPAGAFAVAFVPVS